MFGMDKKKLQLLPHDVVWKDDFLFEKQRIKAAFDDSAICIEHIGSTAIPNIYAKPILDIAILCGEKGLENLAEALVKLGYEYRGQFDDESGHFYAVLDKENIRYCQVHIYTEANADWHLKLRFRDVLSKNAELAREYNDYKLELAKRVSNKSEYAAIKTKWVDKFILKVL
ncbi:MAG TPA: GrpB family protein [Pyrinomonadaceae bacterium]|nr:GrpB family protein [Pyrinomonadaceae bacterium]